MSIVEEELALESGRSLQKRRGAWILFPDNRTVEVEVDAPLVTITDPDTGSKVRLRIAQEPAQPEPPKPARVAKQPSATKPAEARATKPAGDAGRWATLNAFADLIARHLTASEQVVWDDLFRNARDGIASVSTRDIAARRNMAPKTVTAALMRLRAVGLIWLVHLSRHKGTASRYGIHAKPDQCLQRCIEANHRRKGWRHGGGGGIRQGERKESRNEMDGRGEDEGLRGVR